MENTFADGTTYDIENLHTDAIDGADDMNIVGVRLTMTYGETMKFQCPAGCVVQRPKSADTISGDTEHAGFTGSAEVKMVGKVVAISLKPFGTTIQ